MKILYKEKEIQVSELTEDEYEKLVWFIEALKLNTYVDDIRAFAKQNEIQTP